MSRVEPRPGTKDPFVPGGGFTRDKRPPHIFPSFFALPINTWFLDLRLVPPPSPAPPHRASPTSPSAVIPSSAAAVDVLHPGPAPAARAQRPRAPPTSRRRPEPRVLPEHTVVLLLPDFMYSTAAPLSPSPACRPRPSPQGSGSASACPRPSHSAPAPPPRRVLQLAPPSLVLRDLLHRGTTAPLHQSPPEPPQELRPVPRTCSKPAALGLRLACAEILPGAQLR